MSSEPAALHKFIPFAVRDAFSDPEQLLHAYFHQSTVGLCILDLEFRYLAINPALAQINGLPPAAHLGKTCREVVHDLFDAIEPKLREMLGTGQPVMGLQLSGMLPTRVEVGHWIVNYFPLKDARGKVKQIGCLVVEITEQKKLEASLRQLTATLQLEKDRLQMLREIDTTLASNLHLQPLFPAITACIGKVIPYDLAGTWLYDRKDRVMRIAAIDSRVGEVFREGETTPVAECMLGQTMLAGTSRIVNHAELMAAPFPAAKKLLEHGIQSSCTAPLITPKGPIGAVALASRDDHAFSPGDLNLLVHAASSIALAVENSLAHAASERQKALLQALREIDTALLACLDLEKLLPAVSDALGKVVPHEHIGVYVYDESAKMLRCHALDSETRKITAAEERDRPLHSSLAGQALLQRRTTLIDYEGLSVCPFPLARVAVAHGVRSICFVPLIVAEAPLGVLAVSTHRDRAFGREQVELLESVASVLAQAIRNALAHADIKQEKARLQALREIDDMLLACLDLREIPRVVSRCLQRTLPHEDLAISVHDEKAGGLRAYGSSSELKRRVFPASGVLLLEDSLTGRAFAEGSSRIYNHAELLTVPFSATRRALEQGIRSVCFLPLSTSEGRIGVLTLNSKKDENFRLEDLHFLEQVASALAQSLRNALAHKELQEEKKRLQVLLNVCSALASQRLVQDAFPSISAYLRRVLRHEYAAFLLFDHTNGLLVRQAIDFPFGRGDFSALEVKTTSGPANKALRESQTMTFSREQLQSYKVDITDRLLDEGIRSLCCVPLIRPKAPMGVLILGSTRANAFLPDDLLLVNQVAAQMAVALENHHVALEIDALKDRLATERGYLEGEVRTEPQFEEIVGQSPALKQTLRQVETVARSDATVLLLGETGTGKELVARAIHRTSKRKDRAFIKLNCAAIPTGLLESELFGHEKGAFTSAVSRKLGRLELADHGTLFLDEIGEIPLELQPKLLRVLQDHEFERLGGTKTIKVDLRLIAATNRDLSKSVQDNQFRSDLFYRLNVFPIRLPALRERREDIPLLVRHFIRELAHRLDRNIETIPTETMHALINWDWPGNVRELENFIERSIILSEGSALLAPLGELQLGGRGGNASADTLKNAEREHIIRVLRETGGVISGANGAARRLGLKRSTLQSKMDRLEIRRQDYSSHTSG